MFPIFEQILADAHALHEGHPCLSACPLARDLCDAWARLLHRANTTNAGVGTAGWILATDGDIRRLLDMPEKAQNCLSLAIIADQASDFEMLAVNHPHGGQKHVNNWRAETNKIAIAAWSAMPWTPSLFITNNAFLMGLHRRYRMLRPRIAIAPRNCTACNHNNNVPGDDIDGDHDEATCDRLKGMRGTGGLHDVIRDLLAELLRQCKFKNIRVEPRDWDTADTNPMGVPRPTRGTAAGRRQPDIVCTDPESNITYVFDVRTAWKISSTSSGAYKTGDLANEGEAEKIAHWAYVTQYHEAFRNDNAVFVPFGLEVSGGLGDAATAFLDTAFSWVRQTQDPDVYHWSSSSFQRYWYARVGAAIIRQRARIGMAAAGRDRKHNERTSGLGSYAP